MRHAKNVKPKVLKRLETDLKSKSAEVDAFYNSQEKSAKQEKNWVDYEKILDFHKRMKREIKASGFENTSRKQLQKYLMLSMHGPLMPPPRLELSSLILGQVGKLDDTHNYLFRKNRQWNILINSSKISSKKGPQLLDKLPKEVNSLLNRYVKVHNLKTGDPLFVNLKGKQLSKNAYAKRFRNMMWHEFQRNLGVSLMRNIYLTSKYKSIPNLSDMQNTSNMMLHSLNTALQNYVKK